MFFFLQIFNFIEWLNVIRFFAYNFQFVCFFFYIKKFIFFIFLITCQNYKYSNNVICICLFVSFHLVHTFSMTVCSFDSFLHARILNLEKDDNWAWFTFDKFERKKGEKTIVINILPFHFVLFCCFFLSFLVFFFKCLIRFTITRYDWLWHNPKTMHTKILCVYVYVWVCFYVWLFFFFHFNCVYYYFYALLNCQFRFGGTGILLL